MDFASVLERMAEFLDAAGQPWAVVGGVALAAYGVARTTLDLDLAVSASAQGEVVAFMERLGYETLHRSTGFSNHRHASEGAGRVDFVYVSGETERRLFAATRELRGPGGRTVAVPKPEHLIAMKVQAMRDAPERTFQELADIGHLLRLPGVDRDEVRATFAAHDLGDRYDELRSTL